MSRIVWTDPALKDMEGIRAYIARDSEFYANALVLDIVEAVERLARFPRLGRFVPELHDGHTREIPGACPRIRVRLRRRRFWPNARSEAEAMQRRASWTPSDVASGRKSRRPFGLRRQRGACRVASPQRCAPLHRLRRRALHSPR